MPSPPAPGSSRPPHLQLLRVDSARTGEEPTPAPQSPLLSPFRSPLSRALLQELEDSGFESGDGETEEGEDGEGEGGNGSGEGEGEGEAPSTRQVDPCRLTADAPPTPRSLAKAESPSPPFLTIGDDHDFDEFFKHITLPQAESPPPAPPSPTIDEILQHVTLSPSVPQSPTSDDTSLDFEPCTSEPEPADDNAPTITHTTMDTLAAVRAHPPPTVEQVIALAEAHARENTEWFYHSDMDSQAAINAAFDALRAQIFDEDAPDLEVRPTPTLESYVNRISRREMWEKLRAWQFAFPDIVAGAHHHFDGRLVAIECPAQEYQSVRYDLCKKARMTLRGEYNLHRMFEEVLEGPKMRVSIVNYLMYDGHASKTVDLCLPADIKWDAFQDELKRASVTWETKENGFSQGYGLKEGLWRYNIEPDMETLVELGDARAFMIMKKVVMAEEKKVVIWHDKVLEVSNGCKMYYRELMEERAIDPIVDENGEPFFDQCPVQEVLAKPWAKPAENLDMLDGLKDLPANQPGYWRSQRG